MEKTAVIYFSKDRPLQLELAITTNNLATMGFSDCKEDLQYVRQFVLYKASNTKYDRAYLKLIEDFPHIVFLREKVDSFKENLLYAIKDPEYKYVSFVTDDTVFVKDYSLKNCVELLEAHREAIGVSLRLGVNTKTCYPYNKPNNKPHMVVFDGDFILFDWTEIGFGDFGYPLELSSSVYDLYYIRPILEGFAYDNPNELEFLMSQQAEVYENACPMLACYETSRAFSIPVNKVRHSVFQYDNLNRVGTSVEYSTDKLLELFNEGYLIDIDPLMDYEPSGCHEEVEFSFVKKGE